MCEEIWNKREREREKKQRSQVTYVSSARGPLEKRYPFNCLRIKHLEALNIKVLNVLNVFIRSNLRNAMKLDICLRLPTDDNNNRLFLVVSIEQHQFIHNSMKICNFSLMKVHLQTIFSHFTSPIISRHQRL